jgi:hypothetical protein
MAVKDGKGGRGVKITGRGHIGILPVQRPVFDRAVCLDRTEGVRCAAGKILRLQAQNDPRLGFAGRVWTWLLDDDRTLHVRVEFTEVLNRPGRVEGLCERFAGCDGA